MDIIGFNTYSHHTAAGLRSATPGIYVKYDRPFINTYGALINSEGRFSILIARTKSYESFEITYGLITGYTYKPVLPVIVPSKRVQIVKGMDLRISLIYNPHGGSAISSSIEFELK
jgi:hypothetical protein